MRTASAAVAALAKGVLRPADADAILEEVERTPHLFAQRRDADCYAWLRTLGCYSPIIHLRQTDGISSRHRAFTAPNNRIGIIRGEKVLRALKESCDRPADVPGNPRRLCGRRSLLASVHPRGRSAVGPPHRAAVAGTGRMTAGHAGG